MIEKEALRLHKKLKGKLEVVPKVIPSSKKLLSLVYTPGVAEPCKEIARNVKKVYEYTQKGNSVAVVSDGSSVLGLGNLGAEAALPVMEGKAVLFKTFAGIDAYPLCLATQETREIVRVVKAVAPVFGGVNLEDIGAPRCFEVEKRLQGIGIPVFHDDQHGTAIVVLAGLMNALRVAKKRVEDVRVVVNGAGAAGTAITKMLSVAHEYGLFSSELRDILVCDHEGIIYSRRKHVSGHKKQLARITNKEGVRGVLSDAMKGSDVFIGVSRANLMNERMVRSMGKKPIIFAMANPVPEIMPGPARKAGAFVVATGRSDFPNQINNVLVFPGFFRGLLDARAPCVTEEMKMNAVNGLARVVKKPTRERIIPSVFEKSVVQSVARAVREVA